MERSDKEQSTHDRKVREIARNLKKQGYSVKADVSRYAKPASIGKYKRRPDIEATKSGQRRIIEVETPRSLRTDKEQIKTFIRHATHKKRTSFDIVVTKPRKSSR
ncbi:hypothetical protein ES703_42427 [subsurface metagenome]